MPQWRNRQPRWTQKQFYKKATAVKYLNFKDFNTGMSAQEVILDVEYLNIGETLTSNVDGNTEAQANKILVVG